ncbi:hypothetical protein WJX74_001865 [Apatococcus lobatus]|uniref:RNA demethylase ALKBH5 n=1 Tax=Apatococcus lobatus TaxID=904363 RepID=A0AAW1RNY0_9CHLO
MAIRQQKLLAAQRLSQLFQLEEKELDQRAKRKRSCPLQKKTSKHSFQEVDPGLSQGSSSGTSNGASRQLTACGQANQLSDEADSFTEPPPHAVKITHLTVNSTKLREGDSAYVVTSADFDWETDTREPCALCGQLPEPEDSPAVECDNCLRGYHLSCLQQAGLEEALEQIEWLCDTCRKDGRNPISTSTPAGKLLSGSSSLGLCKIESIWKLPEERDEEGYFSGRWYLLPEETRQGRKGHHHRREVLLSGEGLTASVGTLLLPAEICLTYKSFCRAAACADDIFLCRQGYDLKEERPQKLAALRPLAYDDIDWLHTIHRKPQRLPPDSVTKMAAAALEELQAETNSDTSGMAKTIYQLKHGGYFGVRVYQNMMTAPELAAIEDQVLQMHENRDLLPETAVDLTGQRVSGRVKYMFGARYCNYGAAQEPQVCWDVPPIPDWLQEVARKLDEKLPGLLPSPRLVNMAVVNMYERAGAKLLPHIDSLDLFQRPIISLRLLSDSAVSFGAKMGRCNVKDNRSHRIAVARGSVMVMEGPAADHLQHCIVPQDVHAKSASVIFRMLHPRQMQGLRTE